MKVARMKAILENVLNTFPEGRLPQKIRGEIKEDIEKLGKLDQDVEVGSEYIAFFKELCSLKPDVAVALINQLTEVEFKEIIGGARGLTQGLRHSTLEVFFIFLKGLNDSHFSQITRNYHELQWVLGNLVSVNRGDHISYVIQRIGTQRLEKVIDMSWRLRQTLEAINPNDVKNRMAVIQQLGTEHFGRMILPYTEDLKDILECIKGDDNKTIILNKLGAKRFRDIAQVGNPLPRVLGCFSTEDARLAVLKFLNFETIFESWAQQEPRGSYVWQRLSSVLLNCFPTEKNQIAVFGLLRDKLQQVISAQKDLGDVRGLYLQYWPLLLMQLDMKKLFLTVDSLDSFLRQFPDCDIVALKHPWIYKLQEQKAFRRGVILGSVGAFLSAGAMALGVYLWLPTFNLISIAGAGLLGGVFLSAILLVGLITYCFIKPPKYDGPKTNDDFPKEALPKADVSGFASGVALEDKGFEPDDKRNDKQPTFSEHAVLDVNSSSLRP